MRSEAVSLVFVLSMLTGCAHGDLRFPLREPMWRDDDMRPFGPEPEEYESPVVTDGMDQTTLRPLSRFFAVDPGGESTNVNAMDEIPDSSWFTNRLSTNDLSREQIVQAGCNEAPLDPRGPWIVKSGKRGGKNAGFIIEDPSGRKFLIKLEVAQPERASTADLFGSILYWAAGYNAPCNRVVFFDPSILQIDPEAKVARDGNEDAPLTREILQRTLDDSFHTQDGLLRGLASRFLEGRPLGPWRYVGTRDDDPNDVVPHEDRREIRASMVIASWIAHVDLKEDNTLDMWIAGEDGRGFIRHHFIDFGDSLGTIWNPDPLARRLGHSYTVDLEQAAVDLVTLGAVRRPWERGHMGPGGVVLGYFDSERFVPDAWRPSHPISAFSRMTERDASWMARILAHFDDGVVAAMLDEAKIENRAVHRELYRVLVERRIKLLSRWFREISPLARPALSRDATGSTQLCLRDLALRARTIASSQRTYSAAISIDGDDAAPLGVRHAVRLQDAIPTARDPSPDLCVTLPRAPGASRDNPVYVVVEVRGGILRREPTEGPLRVHMYDLGDTHRIVGLERPDV